MSGCDSGLDLVVTSACVASVLLWLYLNALQGWSPTRIQCKQITARLV